jgi:hypothetical protein
VSEKAPKATLSKGLERYTILTYLFDQAFRVPGTKWRFGLDALLGLLPGAGDVVGALVGAYGVLVARELGAPASIQFRMLANVALDAFAGAVPILGDIFDFAFKAHVRNRVLMEKWLQQPHATARRSTIMLVVIPLVLIAILIGAIWLSIAALYWLITAIA